MFYLSACSYRSVVICYLSFVNVFEFDEEAPSNNHNQMANRLYKSNETPKILQNVPHATDKVSKCEENVHYSVEM